MKSKKFKNDIKKYDEQISTLKNDSMECVEDLGKIEERIARKRLTTGDMIRKIAYRRT